jgi:hypothetical protein
MQEGRVIAYGSR